LDGTVPDPDYKKKVEEMFDGYSKNSGEPVTDELREEIEKCYQNCLEDAMKEEKDYTYDKCGHTIKVKSHEHL